MSTFPLFDLIKLQIQSSPEGMKNLEAFILQSEKINTFPEENQIWIRSLQRAVHESLKNLQYEYRKGKFIRRKGSPRQKRNEEFDRLLAQGLTELQAATQIAQSNDPNLIDKKLKVSTIIKEHRPPKGSKKKGK